MTILSTKALCEEKDAIMDTLDFSQMQNAAEELESGIDVRQTVLSIISGETMLDGEFICSLWNGMKLSFAARIRNIMAAFMLPLAASAVFRRLAGNSSAGELLCACGCITAFFSAVKNAFGSVRSLVEGIAGLLEASVPILTGLSAMGGGTSSAALITPMSALIGEAMVQLLGKWGVYTCGCAAVCACAMAIGPALRLEGIFGLFRRAVQVGAGLILALFAGLLKVQGMLGARFDSAAVKTARFAVDKLVPSVGGGIADTLDAALTSVILIKGAVGVAGMLVLAVACAVPLMELTSALIAIRITRAVLLSASDNSLMNAAEAFGDVFRMLFVVCATAVTLGLILIGAAISAGRSIIA